LKHKTNPENLARNQGFNKESSSKLGHSIYQEKSIWITGSELGKQRSHISSDMAYYKSFIKKVVKVPSAIHGS
jgi:hypothetical protein